MFQRTLPLISGCLSGLIVTAVMAPGAPACRKKHNADTSATLVAQGHTLFLTNCSPCHGANAEGDDGPSLHYRNISDTFIGEAVKSGFKGEMPSFGSKLKVSEMKALVAYVHSLQK